MLEEKDKRIVFRKLKEGYLKYIGILLCFLSAIFLIVTFFPVVDGYINYLLRHAPEDVQVKIVEEGETITETSNIDKDTKLIFVDSEFGLYIPKINANAKVIANVDPYIEDEYINALYKGVAHASGSSFPNQSGNVFLFAHSAVNFYEQSRFNIYFYFLNTLEEKDKIYVSYNERIYEYVVLETKIVDPTEIEYLGKYTDEDTLTLMSCWPVGTNWKRIIVIATREPNLN